MSRAHAAALVAAHKIGIRVNTSWTKSHKVNCCSFNLGCDPILKLSHSCVDFRVTLQCAWYSKACNSSLDPGWALFALQWSSRVPLIRIVNRTKHLTFFSSNYLACIPKARLLKEFVLYLTCSFVLLTCTNHVCCDFHAWYSLIIAAALLVSNDRNLNLLQWLNTGQRICGRQSWYLASRFFYVGSKKSKDWCHGSTLYSDKEKVKVYFLLISVVFMLFFKNPQLFTFRLVPLGVATTNQVSLFHTSGLAECFTPNALSDTTLSFLG